MTLREKIEESAFWHGQTCVQCGNTAEEEDGGPCDECGGVLVDSRSLLALMQQAEEEEPT